jgi:hypothetical protein
MTDPLHEDVCTFILSHCYCFVETTWALFEARKVLKDLNVTFERFDCKLLHL